METVWTGRLVGTFHGYKSARVYQLSDGSIRKQDDLADEPVYREYPAARLTFLSPALTNAKRRLMTQVCRVHFAELVMSHFFSPSIRSILRSYLCR
jgi:hypothetical protein